MSDSPWLSYYIGLDLGQSQDYTALAIVEEPVWIGPASEGYIGNKQGGWVSPSLLDPWVHGKILEDVEDHGRPPNPPLSVRYLERLPLGTRYSAVVERVKQL